MPLHSTSRRTSRARTLASASSITGMKRPSASSRSDDATRMTQQALRRQDDQRQRIGLQQQRLTPQQVEILRRGRAVDEPQVDVGGRAGNAQAARSSDPGPGLRSRAAAAAPATASAPTSRAPRSTNWSMIDLRAVDEVAVLRFPEHQAARLLHVVAELEADASRSRSAGCCGSRTPRVACGSSCSGDERLAGLDVVEHGVAMAERAALDVLAGQPDRRCRRRESTRNASSSAAAQSIVASSGVVEHRRGGVRARVRACGCDVKPSGTVEQRRVQLAQALDGHRRLDLPRGARRRVRRQRLDADPLPA